MKKKKPEEGESEEESKDKEFDPELLRMYMMGATNPGFSNKFEHADEVVDLHLENIQSGKGKIPSEDALFHQLEELDKALDKAIAAGKMELRVVHGLGKGKLKQEVNKLLDKHPQVKSYENDYHSRYGYGSTIIYFY